MSTRGRLVPAVITTLAPLLPFFFTQPASDHFKDTHFTSLMYTHAYTEKPNNYYK